MADTLDNIIRRFCWSDGHRPALTQPASINGNVYAADGQQIIVAPQKYFSKEFEPHEKFPDCEAVFPVYDKNIVLFSLSASDLIEQYKQIPVVDIYEVCGACEGSQKHKCTCGHYHDCHECEGTGKSKNISHKDVDPNTYWTIQKIRHKPRCLLNIASVAKAIGQDTVNVCYSQAQKGSVITVDDIKVLIAVAWTDPEQKGVKEISIYPK